MTQTLPVRAAVVETLTAADVNTVFTLLSDTIMDLVATLETSPTDVTVVHTRHEQGAVTMADGYARTTGDIGVCLVGMGPAIAQTGTALVAARKRGSPVLVVVPEPHLSPRDSNAAKRFRQDAFLQATIGGGDTDRNRYGTSDSVVTVRSVDTIVSDLAEAIRRLRTGEGPIVLQVAADVLDGELTVADGWTPPPTVSPEQRPPPGRLHGDPAAIEAAVDAYLDADATKPPVVVAGIGTVESGAGPAIEAFAERTSALLATTVQARGLFASHPWELGFVGTLGSTVANTHLRDADFVLAVGCTLNRYTTDAGRLLDAEATVVHVDADARAIGRHTPITVGVVGDASTTLEAFVAELDRRGIDRDGTFWTPTRRRRLDAGPDWGTPTTGGDGIDPRTLVTRMNDALPADRVVLTDAGHHLTWVVDGIDIASPDAFVWTLDFAAIGQSIPLGIGVATGTPDRTCVVFCGDAGVMMSLPELETAVRHDVPLVFVVVNDRAMGAEYHRLAADHAPTALVEPPELAAVASALGLEGYRVAAKSDLDAALDVLASPLDGPVLLDCLVDREIVHPKLH